MANLTDGGNLSGTTGPALTLTNVQTNDAGSYQVVVTNSVGSVTSAVASLTVGSGFPTCFPECGRAGAGQFQSAKYLDFQHYVQPYLDNFGVPYTVLDISPMGSARASATAR